MVAAMTSEPEPLYLGQTADAHIIAARRRSGLAIMLVSALIFSTAGIFTKGVTADAWTVVFWRALFAVLFTMAYIGWRGRFSQELPGMGLPGFVIAILGASGSGAFILSFKLTTIANVSLIYASAPFLSAGMAWLWFRERIERRILVAALVAIVGVGLIVGNSLGRIHVGGDLLALWMTVMLSLMMVIYRRYPDTPAAGPNALSCLLLMPVALALSTPFQATWHEIAVMASFGLVFAIASVTLSEGARRLPPAEAALISALETPLAILWGWLLFQEIPAWPVSVGGTLILLAVFGSQAAALMRRRTG